MTPNPVIVLVIYVLAVARLTRLFNHDTVLDGFRLALSRRARNDEASNVERHRWSKLIEFLGCPWCIGFWLCLATAIGPVLYLHWSWWTFPVVGFATSMLVGTAAPLSDGDEIVVIDDDDA